MLIVRDVRSVALDIHLPRMAYCPMQRGQIDGKESPLKFDCESESFVSEKEHGKLLSDFMSRLSRYIHVAVQNVVSNRGFTTTFIVH